MNMRVGGSLLYPIAPNIPNDELIYRPEYGGGGLLNSGRNFYKPGNVGADFAGGSLLGQYYDAATNTFKPLQPSGVYTTNPEDSATTEDGDSGGGAFKLPQLMSYEAALRGANFGDRAPMSVFSGFEDMGDGTYDIKKGSPLFGFLSGKDIDGNDVPLNQAVYGSRHARAGEVLDPRTVDRLIKARLSGIDFSGGFDGPGDGDGGGGTGSGVGGNDSDQSDDTGPD